MSISDRLFTQMKKTRVSQAELARRVGISQQTIGKLLKGESRSSSHLHKIARELKTTAEYLVGETDDPSLGAASVILREGLISDMNLVGVRVVDFNLGLGATYLEDFPEENIEYFPSGFLERITGNRIDNIILVRGIGDSMYPTIADHDLLAIDCHQNILGSHDKIWALSIGEIGTVKRLRAKSDGNIELLSDNKQVPAQIVMSDEIKIIGRVVGILRKV